MLVGYGARKDAERSAMAQTIVAGVDRSDAAEPVADTASWLASTLKTRLLVVHAVEEPVQEAEELLESRRARLRSADDVNVSRRRGWLRPEPPPAYSRRSRIERTPASS
jgi:Universal stress protein family